MQACLVSWQHDSQAQASSLGWEGEQADLSSPPPTALLSCHPSCTNRSMSSPCPWLACVRGKPGQPTFTFALPRLSKCPSGACKPPQNPPAPTDTALGSGGDFMSPFPSWTFCPVQFSFLPAMQERRHQASHKCFGICSLVLTFPKEIKHLKFHLKAP